MSCGAPAPQVTDLGSVTPTTHRTHNAIFVHLADALWTPEMSISDPVKCAGISLSRLTSERLALQCTFCGQGGGAVMCASRTAKPLGLKLNLNPNLESAMLSPSCHCLHLGLLGGGLQMDMARVPSNFILC